MISFKYLVALFTLYGVLANGVNNRIIIGWMKWKELSGEMCDKKMSVEVKDKSSKPFIRPYGWAYKRKARANSTQPK